MPTVDLGLVVGSNGQGVPTGGSAGQILAKNSSSNYDTGWVPMSAAAAAAFGIVENGNAASHTISKGQYVIWKGVLYTADAAIASGTTLAASGGNKNLTAVSGGGLNAMKSDNALKMISYTATATSIAPGDFGGLSANDFSASTPSGYSPVAATSFSTGAASGVVYQINVAATGTQRMMSFRNAGTATSNYSAQITILYAKSERLL